MIAPIEQPTSQFNHLRQPQKPAEIRLPKIATSFDFDDDIVRNWRRKYHQWVWRHPIGAASAAIALGLTMGLLLKRRSRK